MTTLAERLRLLDNRPSGFDWMRLILACSVVAWHTVVTSYGQAFQDRFFADPFLRPPIAAILAMFFALSGFLVAGSLERCRTIISFAGLRIFRIFPALVVEVLLSALILGPLLTKVDLSTYFRDPQFLHYFLNMVGDIHYSLPGVFADNPLPSKINAQLWTVPFELRCYEILVVIGILTIHKHRPLLFVAILLYLARRFLNDCSINCAPPGALLGGDLILCFLLGVGLFRFRDVVVWNRWLALASAAGAAVVIQFPGGDILATVPFAYLTVFLGLCNPGRPKLLFSGDYSYGIFLYGFPIQQAIASASARTQHWYINLALALPATIFVAVCSWWFVEKPVLRHKGVLKLVEDQLLNAIALLRQRVWPIEGIAAGDPG